MASRVFPAGFVPPVYKYRFQPPKVSVYSRIYVKGSKRAYRTPRIHQEWRTKKLMNLTAFFRNRFYEMDRWYKARIEKPTLYPTCYLIDPKQYAKSLSERLKDLEDPNRQLIDIGLPFDVDSKETANVKDAAKKTPEEKGQLEQLARFKKLQLNVSSVQESISNHRNTETRKFFAEHFHIFKDLFHEDAYFYPVVEMKIIYSDNGSPHSVFYGNIHSPSKTKVAPSVSYTATPDSLWTLLMTNPDGNVFEEGKEVLHWMIGNIPGDRIDQGELLCDYIQPLPLKGTGYHRMVFVLFKQEKRLDFSRSRLPQPCKDLARRTFSTADFYLTQEDFLTPAAVSFFQSDWDASCTKCFHETLDMEQPLYQYEWPEPHFEPQQEVPTESQSFNEYLDKYRDYKDIDKEILLKRLKISSPFKPNIKLAKYPNLFFKKDRDTLPSWLAVERIKENAGYGKYKGIYHNPIEN